MAGTRTKYVDAEKLIAEIERKIGICEQQRTDAIEVECYNLADDASARMGELRVLLETITSLQQEQPEVDLENEIITQWSKCNPTDDGMGSEYAIIAVEQFDAIARYFCELGLNAKEDSK